MRDSELKTMRQSVREMLSKMRRMPAESRDSDGVVLHANEKIAVDRISGPTGERWVAACLKVTNEDGILQCREMFATQRPTAIYAHVINAGTVTFHDAIIVDFVISGFIVEVVEVTIKAKSYTEEKA